MHHVNYTWKTRQAATTYGFGTCMNAFAMHHLDGEGASTVGTYLGLTTRQADAAINAGEEMLHNEWLHEHKGGMNCSVTFNQYIRAIRHTF